MFNMIQNKQRGCVQVKLKGRLKEKKMSYRLIIENQNHEHLAACHDYHSGT